MFGCFLPIPYLYYHVVSYPIVRFHWRFNDNRCISTDLEHYFDYKQDSDNLILNQENRSSFAQEFYRKYFHMDFDYIIYNKNNKTIGKKKRKIHNLSRKIIKKNKK
jgi:hypothetical protein